MLYMLDTNAISYLMRKSSARLEERMDAIGRNDSICISAITEAELRFGATVERSVKLMRSLELILDGLAALPWTSQAAKAYATLRAHNRRLGLSAGDIDLLISAHALAEGATLVTSDRAIRRLKGGLVTENWATDLIPQ